jgi:probable phosphoglycerate mutase
LTTTTLILVRHGQTDYNAQSRYQGQLDVPMNDTGRAEVEAAARHLAGVRAAAIYSSDLARCRETARIIGGVLGREPVPAPELRERDFGHLEGLTREEAASRFPDSWEQWQHHRPTWVPPGGESLGEMWGRVLAFTASLWRRHQRETFVIAAHGGPMKAIICDALGAPMDTRLAFPVSNGCINVITRDAAGPAVLLLDETCHLGRLPDDVEAD